MQLMETGSNSSANMNFELNINDPEFDNSDNPYGQWVYHRYSNMASLDDTERNTDLKGYFDHRIPLVDCRQNKESDVVSTQSGVKIYCPSFTEQDFLYGDFYSKRFSWTRLALHFCDNST